MCGIYGMIFHTGGQKRAFSDNARTFFNVLAATAGERGTDATGMARVYRDGKVDVYKDVVPSYEIIGHESWKNMLEPIMHPDVFAMMGHTRKKTHGENIHDNAHPFVYNNKFGTLVGTHNGVVDNHTDFGPTEDKFPVDSANLFYGLSEWPNNEWNSILELVKGNFALAISRAGKFYLTRNSGAPCNICYLPTIKCTAYASSVHMLMSAISLSGFKSEPIKYLIAGKLYWFEQAQRMPSSTEFKEQPKPVQENIFDMRDNRPTTPTVRENYLGKWQRTLMCQGRNCYQWKSKDELTLVPVKGKYYCDSCLSVMNDVTSTTNILIDGKAATVANAAASTIYNKVESFNGD